MRRSYKYLLAAAGSTTLIGTATTSTTTTTTTNTDSSTTTTSTTSTLPAGVPSGYTVVSASALGVKCDGVTNDTNALQNAIGGLQSQQALQLPSGTCLTSYQLTLSGKSNVMVFGGGKDSTILSATDPLHSSFILTGDSSVILQGFQVASPNSTYRTGDVNSRGFYVEKSSGVTLNGVKATKAAGAGVLFYVVSNSKVINSEVANTWADGFHFTGASSNILVQYNKATGTGDDCFASVGYGTDLNRSMQFLDNSCSDNLGSGVTFEGTVGGQAYRNQLTRTGVAAIRLASDSGWNTGVVDQIDVQNNVLTEVKTNTTVDHPAILIYSSYGNVSNLNFAGNSITNPHTWTGARVLNYAPTTASISNITYNSTTNVSTTNQESQCFTLDAAVSGFSKANNTLNSVAC